MRGRGNGGFAAVMAAFFLVLGIVVTYVNGAIFDSGNFANHSLDALDDDAVRSRISTEIAAALIPAGSPGADQSGEAFASASDQLFDNPGFRTIVRGGVGTLHDAVFDRDADAVGVQLTDVGEPVRTALEGSSPSLASQVPPGADVTVFEGDPPSWVLDASRAAESVQFIGYALLGAAALMALLSLAVARFRSVAISTFGISLAIGAVIAIAGMLAAKWALLSEVGDDNQLHDALSGVWGAFFGGLQTELILLAAAGVVVPVAMRLIRTR